MAEKGTPQHDAEGLRMIAGWLDKDSLRGPAAFLRRVAGDIERRATDGQRADPIAWFEAGPSARGADLRTVMQGIAYSTRWHWQAEQPATSNPVWPIFADGQRAGVPEGWKLVPVEPTPEMWAAVNKLDDEMAAGGYDGKGCSIEQAWHCLLAAAPTPPVHHQQQQHEAAQGFAGDRVPENRDFTSTTPPAGDAGRLEGVNKVERESDFSVRLTFDSCRQASAFDRAAMAAIAASKGDE